jgi:hypothetical protein
MFSAIRHTMYRYVLSNEIKCRIWRYQSIFKGHDYIKDHIQSIHIHASTSKSTIKAIGHSQEVNKLYHPNPTFPILSFFLTTCRDTRLTRSRVEVLFCIQFASKAQGQDSSNPKSPMIRTRLILASKPRSLYSRLIQPYLQCPPSPSGTDQIRRAALSLSDPYPKSQDCTVTLYVSVSCTFSFKN